MVAGAPALPKERSTQCFQRVSEAVTWALPLEVPERLQVLGDWWRAVSAEQPSGPRPRGSCRILHPPTQPKAEANTIAKQTARISL